ncbi:hypothetical protein ACFWM3_07640 [Gottfriedia sp. NPDC058432]
MITPIVTFIMNLCLVGILLYGGYLIRLNSVQVGDLINSPCVF